MPSNKPCDTCQASRKQDCTCVESRVCIGCEKQFSVGVGKRQYVTQRYCSAQCSARGINKARSRGTFFGRNVLPPKPERLYLK